LTLGSDGDFYGTTYGEAGGSSDSGTVFKVTTNGVLTSLAFFNKTNGSHPRAGLTLGNSATFYGTTWIGGSSGRGTVFRVTTNGVLTSLVSFNSLNGAYPNADLTLGRDGNLYGTTLEGGGTGAGTLFRVTTNGVFTSLVSFNGTNGASPRARLTMGRDGNLYGTTYSGGSSGRGVIFRLNLASTLSHPRIEILATSANVNLTLAAAAGSSWNIERAVELIGPWTNLGALRIAPNGFGQFQDTNPAFPNVFYRAVHP
jgi:uncharacterized repeat protein (TIGR03803 family)